jgi:hypothetical protein
MKLLKEIRKKLIFFAGDIHKDLNLTGFSWDTHKRLVDYKEALEGLKYAKVGYIGLHRNIGDLSNVAIKGFMKHAWIHEPTFGNFIVEAVSDGVLYRHALHALVSDYVVILKPVVSVNAKKIAWDRAISMVGCPYDDNFTFDLEHEDRIFTDKETALANMRQFGLGLSCSELVALCYVGHRKELGIYRTKLGNREVVLPDAYLSTHFEVVWASKSTTPKIAKKLGLHEEGVEMLHEYWKSKK